MKLTGQLAYSQIKINRTRSTFTIIGIVLATAMLTALIGFASSAQSFILINVGLGASDRALFDSLFQNLTIVFSIIIMISSIIVMSNSFRVSAHERLSQFGILKSVGATKKQIQVTIIKEGLFLCLIGIPIGFLLGIGIQLIGTQVIQNTFDVMYRGLGDREGINWVIPVVIRWYSFLFSGALAFITILVSAWLPARKAAKVPAIEAIRQQGEVKMSRKQVKVSKWVNFLFGFEGVLAAKSLKRSNRAFRATVITLTISIILFIAAFSFAQMSEQSIRSTWLGTDINVSAFFHGLIVDGVRTILPVEESERMIEKMRNFPDTTVMGIGDAGMYEVDLPRSHISSDVPKELWFSDRNQQDLNHLVTDSGDARIDVMLMTVDRQTYEELIHKAGVPDGSTILMNRMRSVGGGTRRDFAPFENLIGESFVITRGSSHEDRTIQIDGVLQAEDIPVNFITTGRLSLTLVIPETDANNYRWFAETADPSGLERYIHQMLESDFRPNPVDGEYRTSVVNIEADAEMSRSMQQMVMTFVIGFIALLTTVGLTNVISTISTNIRSRQREFAMLQSVGMTRRGFHRMLAVESIMSSMKALLIGVPLGLIASYAIYQVFYSGFPDLQYQIPWMQTIACVMAVFLISWLTMRFAIHQLKLLTVHEIL